MCVHEVVRVTRKSNRSHIILLSMSQVKGHRSSPQWDCVFTIKVRYDWRIRSHSHVHFPSSERRQDYSRIVLVPTFKWLLLSRSAASPSVAALSPPPSLRPSLPERDGAVQERRGSRDYAALEVFVV